jgi:acyl carrier protein
VTSIENRARRVVTAQFRVSDSKVTRETKFTDLGADSLDHVELLMDLEEEFDIAVSDCEIGTIETFGDAVALIERRLSST